MKTNAVIEDYKRELLTTFFVQKRIIYFVAAAIFIASILVSFLWPKTYAAYGSILVKGKKAEKSPDAIEKEEIKPFPVTKEDLNSESEILTSPDVIRNTLIFLKENNLKNNAASKRFSFLALFKIKKKTTGNITIEESEIYKIKKRITTEIVPITNVIKITVQDRDSKYAVLFLDTLMEQFLKYRMQLYNSAESKSFFKQQVTESKKSIEDKEDELMKLYKEGDGVMPAKEIENNLLIKKDLEQDLYHFKQSAIEKAQIIQQINNALQSREISFFSFLDGNESITGLSKSLQALVAERNTILSKYSKESEKAQYIDEQVTATYNALKKEISDYNNNIKRQLETINEKIDSVEQRIEKIQTQNMKLQELTIATERVKRDIEIYKLSYDIFSKRKEESRITSSSEAGTFLISIMGKAFPSSGPIFPIPMLLIPIGLITGLMTGMSLGFLKEYLDQTFKKPEDVFKYAQLPVLLFIPFMSDETTTQSKKPDIFTTLKSKFVPLFKKKTDLPKTPSISTTTLLSLLKTICIPVVILLWMLVTVIVIGCQVVQTNSINNKYLPAYSMKNPTDSVTASASFATEAEADTAQKADNTTTMESPAAALNANFNATTAELSSDIAKLFSTPVPGSTVIAYLEKGDKMAVINTYKRGWLKVKTSDGTEGWVYVWTVNVIKDTSYGL